MERLAERVANRLESRAGDALVGVSYYSEREVDHVYRSEWAAEKYTAEQVDDIVGELQLESIGHGVHAEHQEEPLHATIRVYEEMLDVAVPVDSVHAVVFALRRETGGYSLLGLLDAVEEEVEASDVESRIE